MSNSKDWKSFSEQLELLKSRNLVVDDEKAALDYLERIGYYRLSGYLYSFRMIGTRTDKAGSKIPIRHDNFNKGSRLEDAVKLYVFDKNLRLLALDALERIELSIRVDIAYMLGKRDVHAHENPELLHGNFTKKASKNTDKTGHQLWLHHHKRLVRRSCKLDFVNHYLNKYGKLPIWVAIEIWDFGTISKLFAGMNFEDKNVIANKYGLQKGQEFEQWLRSLNYVRNVAAHHSRLWNINVLELSRAYKEDEFWQNLNTSKPFFYFCIMQKLLNVICPNSMWGRRFMTLLDGFPYVDNQSVGIQDMGVTADWKGWGLWSVNS